MLGLLLVFRCSFALARFWEARSALTRLVSLLLDVAREAKTFSVKDPANPPLEAILFQNKIGRLLRLQLIVMLQNLTGKTDLFEWGGYEYLEVQHPNPCPPDAETPTPPWEEHEKAVLRLDARTRPHLVSTWILEAFLKPSPSPSSSS